MMSKYHGYVTHGDWGVEKDGKELSPKRSLAVYNHSPDGFAWGYYGSAPAQLALALLLEEGLSDERAIELHQPFKDDFIAIIEKDLSWTLTSEQIQTWIKYHPPK